MDNTGKLDATISIQNSRKVAPVDPRIHSGFIEHLGRCIYGGILPTPVDPDNPNSSPTSPDLITPSGFRSDVLHLIRDELRVPIMRWPGGNYVSSYRWKDGIGDKSLRPRRPELAWGSEESNQFGTDEFIQWCHEAKCEPYICLNMGTGTLEDALDWVEYCNGTSNTYWANQRRRNNGGRAEPHAVKYWALGNEMWGAWQVGQLTAAEYVRKAQQWAHALKLLDPSIILISCGQTGLKNWDATVLQGLTKQVELHSIHLYTSLGDRDRSDGWEYERNVFGPEAAEQGIDICKHLIDLARLENGADKTKQVKIAFDEWGSWDETKGTPQNGLEQHFTLTDALAVASWLNVFIRKADIVAMANYAQAVNVIAPIITSPTGLFKQTIYHPLYLFANYMRAAPSSSAQTIALQLHIDSPSYTGVTLPTWINAIRKDGGCKWIDASAVIVELEGEGGKKRESLRIAVVNRHRTSPIEVRFQGLALPDPGLSEASGQAAIEVHEVYHRDPEAKNSFENPDNVRVNQTTEKLTLGQSWKRSFKEHSFTLLVF